MRKLSDNLYHRTHASSLCILSIFSLLTAGTKEIGSLTFVALTVLSFKCMHDLFFLAGPQLLVRSLTEDDQSDHEIA